MQKGASCNLSFFAVLFYYLIFQDGRLLQPTTPAVSIDAVILQAALGGNTGPVGEVWLANTEQSGLQYGHLFVADLKHDWIVTPSHLGYLLASEFWIFESNFSVSDSVIYFSEQSPLKLSVPIYSNYLILTHFFHFPILTNVQACGIYDFSLWTLVPIIQLESSIPKFPTWSLLGEMDKWIPVSTSRFSGLSVTQTGAKVTAVGSVDEKISVAFADPLGSIIKVECIFDENQVLVISTDGSCL